jgi:4-diphosphocytidyl-2-C-methyl-D-erythritol kinase
MTHRRLSPCKINLVLNILGRRPDGFHDLETLFLPVPLFDEISAEIDLLNQNKGDSPEIRLTCSNPALPCDSSNLVHRAASRFMEAHGGLKRVTLHLEKRLPLAAGLGAGSANAAITLRLLNEMVEIPLASSILDQIAASLGSDVNFFLQEHPALATGRGEKIEPLAPFTPLSGVGLFLFHPGFGVSTPWAFKELANFPEARNGQPGRARDAANVFSRGGPAAMGGVLYNGLEAPVLRKFPILSLYREFLRDQGAFGTLMCGSGSTTFGLFPSLRAAESAIDPFRAQFGSEGWLQVVGL